VRAAAFGDLARRCVEELHKGSRCLVEGALRQSSWTDKKTGETHHWPRGGGMALRAARADR